MVIKKRIFVITAFCLMISIMGILCGCADKQDPKSNPLPYNAELIIDHFEVERKTVPTDIGYFTEDFWRENTVRVIYLNENYNSNDPTGSEYLFDETLPESITHIITTEQEYNRIFTQEYQNRHSIDFEKEMLIVFVSCGGNGTRTTLTDVSLNGKDLTVNYKYRIVTNDNGTEPERHVRVIKIDKLDVETAQMVSLGRI